VAVLLLRAGTVAGDRLGRRQPFEDRPLPGLLAFLPLLDPAQPLSDVIVRYRSTSCSLSNWSVPGHRP
jgi:hypothetical protein